MRENWRDYVKMGTIHFMSYPECLKGEGPILETLTKIVKDDFFEMVEISWIKDPEVRKKVRDLLQSSGMIAGYGAQPPLLIEKMDLNGTGEWRRREAVNLVKKCIDEAEELGIKRVALLSGKNWTLPRSKEIAKNLLEISLQQICSYAAKKQISICLETFDYDIDKCCLIGRAEDATDIAERIKKDFPDFGLIYDLSHVPLLREDPKKALKILKDHLVHIHIGNCVMRDKNHLAYGDQHPPFGIPEGENGVDELKYFLGALFEIDYLAKGKKERPTISFEVKPLAGQKPEKVIAQSKRVFRKAWRQL